MNRTRSIGQICVVLLAACCAAAARADDALQIAWQSSPALFANHDFDYRIQLTSRQATRGRLSWQLTVLHRTLGRGEQSVDLQARKTTTVDLPLRIPPLRPGVAQEATLQVSFVTAGQASTSDERKLWLFSRDPFAGRQHWLQRFEIELYDPVGKTGELFSQAKLPYRMIRSLDALDLHRRGVVIIAPGVSLKSKPALAQTVWELAAGGRIVLWFAPRDGSFDFGFSAENKAPGNLSLAGSTIVKGLDHRLDPGHWSDRESDTIGFRFAARRNRPQLQVTSGADGWWWFDAEFDDPAGRLIVCGGDLTDRWQESPTPRYLLAAMLQYADNEHHHRTQPLDRQDLP
ncbi:hypothetical protein Enr13x_52960 [Stieleria neptunia]|uniref:Uncharacterized protein n=1 Tax=Stieleria neptunia TaxID=2527979 RepID=A0A518HXG4_9BACT|nr:hypothetical protein [Stieleria neptunia]QDV45417.1 hypothetical protein Enr13x_52960 [Stieleria neptunia]